MMRQRLLPITLAAALTACVHQRPEVPDLAADVPAAFDHVQSTADAEVAVPGWSAFGDPAVTVLVDEALTANQNLAAGRAVLAAARASVRVARSSLFPDLAASASAGSSTATGLDHVDASGRLSAGYQLDLFGANRATREAALAAYQAQGFDQQALSLSVQADTAFLYFSVLALRQRYEVAQANLDISERIFAIVRTRYDAGAVASFDLASQEAALANARARVVALRADLVSLESSLAVVLGRAPQGFEAPRGDLMSTVVPAIDPGLPADLLDRRPDLQSAQAVIRASGADVAAARAAFFPTFDLAAAFTEADLGNPDPIGSLAASLAAPIFAGGALQGQLDRAQAGAGQAIAAYRQATLDALREVDVSLSALATARAREAELLAARDAAERALRLAEIRYRTGADDLTSLLNAQGTRFDAADAVVQARLDRLSAAIDLFVAVGGHWQPGAA